MFTATTTAPFAPTVRPARPRLPLGRVLAIPGLTVLYVLEAPVIGLVYLIAGLARIGGGTAKTQR